MIKYLYKLVPSFHECQEIWNVKLIKSNCIIQTTYSAKKTKKQIEVVEKNNHRLVHLVVFSNVNQPFS